MSDYLTRKELAETFRCSIATVDRARREGDIPAIKIGRLYRFDLAAVTAALTKTEDLWSAPSRKKLRRTA